MTFIAVRCPHCQSDQIVKRGKTARGTQRYVCQNTLCAKGSFLLDYGNRGCLPAVKQTIIDMRLNASGVRDTARSLHESIPLILILCYTVLYRYRRAVWQDDLKA
jgi:transposase-like protein